MQASEKTPVKNETGSAGLPLKESKKIAKPRKIRTWLLVLFVLVMLAGAGTAAFLYINSRDKSEHQSEGQQSEIVFSSLTRPAFAEFSLDLEDFDASVPDYDLGSNMENVANLARYEFSDSMKDQLAEDYFVALAPDSGSNWGRDEFFQRYQSNKNDDIPSFITTDSILHTYHLLYDDALKTLEQSTFYSKMENVSNSMLEQSKEQYRYFTEVVEDEEFATAAKRNVAFYSVGLRLLGHDIEAPTYVADIVNSELEKIDDHEDMTCSAVMDVSLDAGDCYEEDFTQYVPRGHYTRTERLQKYFRAMMWYGRMTFRQNSKSETISALLSTYALSQNEAVYQAWSDVYDATTFMVGSSDDLCVYDYQTVMDDEFNSPTGLSDLQDDFAIQAFYTKVKTLRGPAINSMLVYPNEDVDIETKGFRFTGQRYTLDADIFQQLMNPKVGRNSDGDVRNMPKSLDVLAGMGSEEATSILENEGDFEYESFEENLLSIQDKIDGYTEEEWTQNLYYGWLYMLHPFVSLLDDGYPDFMNSDLWVYHDMNTYLGSWTELKHDTILYSKQPYGIGAGGNVPMDLDDRGYVEPRPVVYARLEALAKMTLEGLGERGLLDLVDYEFSEGSGPACNTIGNDQECTSTYSFSSEDLRENLEKLESLANQLKAISIKELKEEMLTDEEYDFIRDYGNELQDIWYFTIHDPTADVTSALDENPVMIIADVATDPAAGAVLEEGLGMVLDMYVIIPVPGELPGYYRVARGVIWSQYEFPHPMNDRLTDEAWRERVRDGDVPDLSLWKQEFIGVGEEVEIHSRPWLYPDQWYPSIEDARTACEDEQHGTFEECGNVCPEYDQDCDAPCEPVCRFY